MHSDKGRGGEAYNMRDMGMNSYHVYQTDRPQEAPVSEPAGLVRHPNRRREVNSSCRDR